MVKKPLKPFIIAALPIKKAEDVVVVDNVKYVDLVELRVDYMDNPLTIDYTALKNKKILVTLRDVSEGGVKEHPIEVKLKLIKTLKDLGILYDVEMMFAEKYGVDCEDAIASLHIMNPSQTDLSRVRDMVRKFVDRAYIAKIATMVFPGYRTFLTSLLELGDNIAVMPMSRDPSLGTTIMLDRIAFTLMGSKLLYCSLGMPTAPGQPKCEDIVAILNKVAELSKF